MKPLALLALAAALVGCGESTARREQRRIDESMPGIPKDWVCAEGQEVQYAHWRDADGIHGGSLLECRNHHWTYTVTYSEIERSLDNHLHPRPIGNSWQLK
jgi:hypothetical protein